MATGRNPEDDMAKPERDALDEILPNQYRLMAASPLACLSQACELLDLALSEDVKERDSLAALARGWMRAAELSHSIQGDK